MKTRRQFIGAVGGGLVTAGITVSGHNTGRSAAAIPNSGALPTNAAAQEKEFWATVQDAFTVDPKRTPLTVVNFSPRVVQDTYLRTIEYVQRAPFDHQRELEPQREVVRQRVAKLVNCTSDEIALTRNTTEALDTIIFGLDLKPGDEVITTDHDFRTIVNAVRQRTAREGIVLKEVRVPNAPAELEDIVPVLEAAFTPRTRAILVSHIMFPNGHILPIRRIADLAHSRGIRVIVDGALSIGVIPVDLQAMGCDYYGTSLHKAVHAPYGTGFLYVRKDLISSLWPFYAALDPHSDSIKKFESIGTKPIAPIVGVRQALDFHDTIGTERKSARLHYLKRYWADQLSSLPNVRFHTHLDAVHSCGIAVVEVIGADVRKLNQYLLEKHGIDCTPVARPDYHGLMVSPFVFTRLDQLDRFAEVLTRVARSGVPA